MEKTGTLSRLLARMKTSLEAAFDDAVSEVSPVEKAVRVEKGEGLMITGPAWAWLQKHHPGAYAYAEPRWSGERYLHAVDGCVVDVIKTADDRHVVVECLEYEGRNYRDKPVEDRRWFAYAFVRKRHAAGEKSWVTSPAASVTDRIELAKAWRLYADRPGSAGIVLKVVGPYEAGESTRWIEILKDQPSATDVHVDGPPKEKKRTYDEETAFIKANQATPAGQQPHAFQSAEWTHKNGHPRCLLCGDEESVTKQCAGVAARPKMEKGAVRVVKVDVKKRVMLGIVHQPDVEDLQGDVISADDIEKACYQFLKDYRAGAAGLRLNHKRDLGKAEAQLVENYVAPVAFDIPQADGGREHVIKGSWLQGWELSPALWSGVEKGEYTGFSMGGVGTQEPITKDADDPALTPAAAQQSVHLTVNVQPSGGATVKREKDGTLTVKPSLPDDGAK